MIMRAKNLILSVLITFFLIGCQQSCSCSTSPDSPYAKLPVQPPADAVQFESGWRGVRLGVGTSDRRAIPGDQIELNLEVFDREGRLFFETKQIGKAIPVTFSKENIDIPEIAEVLRAMREGEEWRLWGVNSHSQQTRVPWPKGAFMAQVEVLRIATPGAAQESTSPPREQPKAGIEAPPPDASKSALGLYWLQLDAPGDSARPVPGDTVLLLVHAWNDAGVSLTQGGRREVKVRLAALPYALVDLVVQMGPHERRRIWLTREIAAMLGGNWPSNMGVLEVELDRIEHAQ
jgi:hypothetical protein